VGNGVFTRAHALHYGIGVPMRKVPTILHELCGVSITQSAIQQEERRRGQNAYAAKTIIETARKRGKSLVSGLMDLFRSDNQASDPIPSDSASGAS